jgi:DNA-binding MarR family transcriptional regulator
MTSPLTKNEKGIKTKMRNIGVYFSIIPSGVMDHEKISDGAKLTYALILGLSNKFGYCFASNSQLAQMRITSSESTIKRHIKELLDNNLVVAEYNQRSDRRLTCNIMPTDREKFVKIQKTVQHAQSNSEFDMVLDQVWKKLR